MIKRVGRKASRRIARRRGSKTRPVKRTPSSNHFANRVFKVVRGIPRGANLKRKLLHTKGYNLSVN